MALWLIIMVSGLDDLDLLTPSFTITCNQSQSITTAHNQWLLHSAWTTTVFSSSLPSPVTDLVLIYESLTSTSWMNSEFRMTKDNHLRNELRITKDESRMNESESESYITTDGQSASLSWNKAPIWGLRPDLDYCLTVAGLLMWVVLCDERTDLSFAITTGPRQRSHSRIRVPLDSRPHFTVSDSRLPFLSPPTTRRVTVEVFDPASTRVWMNLLCTAAYIV
jgi:hypothetical protein